MGDDRKDLEHVLRMGDYDRYPMHGYACPWAEKDKRLACTCPHVMRRPDYAERFGGDSA